MTKLFYIILFSLLSFSTFAQSTNELRQQLNQIISSKNATVGISIKGIEDKDTLSLNGSLKAPMMSVFKFHIALTVLDKVDQGNFH